MDPMTVVTDILASVLPGVTPTGISPVTKGIFSIGWQVFTAGPTYFVKINDDAQTAENFRSARRVSATARAAGLRVPIVHGSGIDDRGRAFLVQQWLDGIDAEDYLAGRGRPDRRQIFRRLGSMLARLHNIPYADGGPTSIHGTVRVRLDRYAERVSGAGLMGEDELRRFIDRLWELAVTVLPPAHPSLIHSDMHLPNVVVGADGELALVDLDFARPGDPIEDFVKIEWWAFDDDEDRAAFHDGYAAHRDRTGPRRDIEAALQLHKLIIALSYLGFFAEKEPEALPEWVDRLDQERNAAQRLFGVVAA